MSSYRLLVVEWSNTQKIKNPGAVPTLNQLLICRFWNTFLGSNYYITGTSMKHFRTIVIAVLEILWWICESGSSIWFIYIYRFVSQHLRFISFVFLYSNLNSSFRPLVALFSLLYSTSKLQLEYRFNQPNTVSYTSAVMKNYQSLKVTESWWIRDQLTSQDGFWRKLKVLWSDEAWVKLSGAVKRHHFGVKPLVKLPNQPRIGWPWHATECVQKHVEDNFYPSK